MSSGNKEGFKPGSIYRIALENFVTYKQVELFPGPSLNMIIGPNGTGKSTFVCAIILGLCGKTSVIGRAKKISEYIRSGCEQSNIEIELYVSPQKNVVITRNFDLECASTWYIDYKIVREKAVQELIQSLNIQVDNLCQLLPQDRVQDFSKMDPQQLLRSTLSAVGGQESINQLEELIKTKSDHSNLGSDLEKNNQMLQENVRLNEGLKLQIDAMKQRKDIEVEIQICERKKLWIEYNALREKMLEYSRDKTEALKIVDSHQGRVKPLQLFMEKAKSNITKLEENKLRVNRQVHNFTDKIKESLSAVANQNCKLMDIDTKYQQSLERHVNKEREVQEANAVLEKLQTDKVRLEQKVGEESKVAKDMKELHGQIKLTNAAIDQLKEKNSHYLYKLENDITPKIRLFQNKIRQLENVDEKRLELLKSYNEDAYQAVLWMRQNGDRFNHPYYEPMMLNISFTDPKFAQYLESTVANRDLFAFTFESTQDMNTFIRTVRNELGLKRVNAVHSQPTSAGFHPPCPIDSLSHLGFYTYLVDTISAPDAITRYLCKQYGVHRIPIGTNDTYNKSGEVPANINYFFTEKHRFTVRVSSYSKMKSSSINEIRPPKLLANTVDVEQLNNLKSQLVNLKTEETEQRTLMGNLDEKLTKLESNLNELMTSRKVITENIQKVNTIRAQIRLQQKKIRDLIDEPSLDMEQIKLTSKLQRKDCILKQCNLQKEICEMYTKLQSDIAIGETIKVVLEQSRSVIVQQEAEFREMVNELENAKATLNNIEVLLKKTKDSAKSKLAEAKRSCDNKLPQDPAFPNKDEFERLPGDLSELQAHCYELQTRIDCMDQSDDQIIKEYEQREREISKLRAKVDNSSQTNKQLEDRINSIRSQWLPPLLELIRNIDVKFGDMFSKLDCSGEVKLDTSAGEDEFSKWGISILVKFRSGEQLQALSRYTQSGGERALTTALYLCALQTTAVVPFRCVDEINQGMDPINERKMFQLLVTVTTEYENSQYFILTPKLLKNLEYNPKIMIHTIMNGRKIMKNKRWKIEKFLEVARSL